MSRATGHTPPSPPLPARRRRLGPDLLLSLLFAGLVVFNLSPLVWGVLTSFKAPPDLFRYPPVVLDFAPTLENYERVARSGFFTAMRNSILYASSAVVLGLSLALLAAYAFDRFRFPLRQALFLLVVASIPLSIGAAALLIPNYVYFTWLGLTDKPFTLPLIYTAHQLPMAIWIIKGSLEAIPRELDEAAAIDGCTPMGVLGRVLLPLCRPALGAAGVLIFVGSWNEFVAGSVMVDSPALKPIQPVIYNFIGYFGREWGPLTASATLAILPIVVAFAFLGRHIVSGLVQGSVKG